MIRADSNSLSHPLCNLYAWPAFSQIKVIRLTIYESNAVYYPQNSYICG